MERIIVAMRGRRLGREGISGVRLLSMCVDDSVDCMCLCKNLYQLYLFLFTCDFAWKGIVLYLAVDTSTHNMTSR